MIDFRQLVLEMISSPSTIITYAKDVNSLKNLKGGLYGKFGIDIAKLQSDWYQKFHSDVEIQQSPSNDTIIENIPIFPYLDFLLFCGQYLLKNKGLTTFDSYKGKVEKADIDAIEVEFIADFNSRCTGSDPLNGYNPLSDKAKNMKAKSSSKGIVGSYLFEKWTKNNFTIIQVINELLVLNSNNKNLKIQAIETQKILNFIAEPIGNSANIQFPDSINSSNSKKEFIEFSNLINQYFSNKGISDLNNKIKYLRLTPIATLKADSQESYQALFNIADRIDLKNKYKTVLAAIGSVAPSLVGAASDLAGGISKLGGKITV